MKRNLWVTPGTSISELSFAALVVSTPNWGKLFEKIFSYTIKDISLDLVVNRFLVSL